MAELQEILAQGQSQISTHLAQLKQAGLVDDRRTGKNAFYRLTAPAELMDLLRKAAAEVPEAAEDQQRSAPGPAQAAGPDAPLFRRTGGQIRPPVRAGALVEGHGRSAAQADAAHGDRRPGRGRRHHLATDGAARQESDRHRQFRKDGGIRRGAGAQARHRQHGIPPGRPGGRAHPQRHGGPGVSQPGAAPRPPSASAPWPRRGGF